jgi:hypothetical protein
LATPKLPTTSAAVNKSFCLWHKGPLWESEMLADFSCRTVVPYELFWQSILATTLVLFRGTLARTRQDTGGVTLAQKATAVKYVKWSLMVPPEEWAAAKR